MPHSFVLIPTRKAGDEVIVCVGSRLWKIEEKTIQLNLNQSRSEKKPSVAFPLN